MGSLIDSRGKKTLKWKATPLQVRVLEEEPTLLNNELSSEKIKPDCTKWSSEAYSKASFHGGEALIFKDASLAEKNLAVRVQVSWFSLEHVAYFSPILTY